MLAKSCTKFLDKKISPENVCHILEAAHRMSDTDIYDKCMVIVKENCLSSLSGKGFLSLCKDCVHKFTVLDDVCFKEEELFEQVIKWAEAECLRQNLGISWENKRNVLGHVLYNIRFPLMDQEYFARNVGVTKLLTSDEKVDVFLYHATSTDILAKCFPNKERMSESLPVLRFSSTDAPFSWQFSNNAMDAISFKTSTDSFLHGILVYGCCHGNHEYTTHVCVRDVNGKELSKLTTTINTKSGGKTYEVKLASPYRLRAGAIYTIEIEMTGQYTYRGIDVDHSVSDGKTKLVTFIDAPSSPNGTDLLQGQIPGLLLT